MENSIEEDITKIEGLKYLTLQATLNDKFICAKIPEDYIQALDHILSDYKRKLKELEELKQEKQDYFEKYQYNLKQNENLTREFNNCIPVQEVKDLKNRILENEEYTVVLEGDKEFPDSTTEATFEKYINLKVLDELVERK